MNVHVLINQSCKGNCEYCFFTKYLDKPEYMSVSDFKKLIYFLKKSRLDSPLKILGGEPTDHPEIMEIFDFLYQERFRFVLITNGLFRQPILNKIIDLMNQGVLMNLALNANFLIKEATKPLLLEHIKNLQEKVKPENLNFSFSLTISSDETVDDNYREIIAFGKLFKLKVLRIALDMRKDEKKYFINNKAAGKRLLKIIQEIKDQGMGVYLGCTFFPCMFDSLEDYSKAWGSIVNIKNTCAKYNSHIDILMDLSVDHCFSLKAVKLQNILDCQDINAVQQKMLKARADYFEQAKLPEDCQKCNSEYKDLCHQVCLSCS